MGVSFTSQSNQTYLQSMNVINDMTITENQTSNYGSSIKDVKVAVKSATEHYSNYMDLS